MPESPPASFDLQLLSQALEASVHSVVIADAQLPDLPIIYVNPAFERLSGYPAAQVIGRNCRFLQGQDRDQAARHDLRQAIEAGRSTTVILRNSRPDGTLFFNELTVSPIHDAAGTVTHFLGFQTDVTGRETASALMGSLQGLTEDLAAARTQQEVTDLVLHNTLPALNAVSGAVLLVQEGRLHVVARRGDDDASIWQDGDLDGHRPSPDALRAKTPLFFRESGELTAAYPELESRTGGVAAVATAVLPMVESGRPLGVIVLDFEEPHEFTPTEIQFLRTLAAQCAIALARAQATTDIQAQIHAQTGKLSRQKAELEAILESLPDAVYVGGPGGITRANTRALDMLGFTALADLKHDIHLLAEQVNTRDPRTGQRLGPEEEPFAVALGGQAHTADVLVRHLGTGEDRLIRNAAAPIRVDGQVVGAVAVNTDITDSQQAQDLQELNATLERRVQERTQELAARTRELEARTQALEGIAQLSGDLVGGGDHLTLIRRTQELVLSLLPPGYAAYFENVEGRWRAQVQVGDVGKPALQQAIDAGFPVGGTPTLDHCTQTLEPYFIEAYTADTDIDPEVAGHLRAAACLPVLVGGQVLGIFNVPLFHERRWDAADRALLVTAVHSLGLTLERARSVFALARRTEELERSNAELAQFAYVASHDLQEPLRTITSFSQLLARRYRGQLDDRADGYIRLIGDATGRMGTLLQDLLAFSRVGADPLRRGPVNLQTLLEQVQQDLHAQVERTGARLVVGPLPTVLGDATQLRQLFQNLLGNALKFHHPERAPEVRVTAQDDGTFVTVQIADNGIGIAPEYAERIFAIFQRLHTREAYEGSGMGLAIARKIVERHGGRLWLESTPGQGTTFQVSLPSEAG
ncbi:ATP-binding protein [Deinococcus radiopugnans]|uniref:histidine kinase n=1 Tax=Deinococcus radiopugnans ATCC 19172 TaxID=585398 RepID=A0A5C4XLW1_9DEIO|nr:ATP-binding protein [Deinococcus radiopugnans]MBB6018735.1 PAS domain S-box-containing protein [Deinococcus radiopugnans ATCC 19172]TNM64388.1 PAS domain S-box protein [Deinococcus radiopugnans ATCC 19172]